MGSLLEVEDLRVHYGKAEALRGVSLKVDTGEVVSIVGANGAGKTTILRTISGLNKLTSGEIRFQGKRTNSVSAHGIVKLGIGHIPAGRQVFAPMTVLDNLKVGAYLRKDKNEVAGDLESVHRHFPILKGRHSQLAGSLSGGEQQMLAVARALMAAPKLLLMDEPSQGLSPSIVGMVADMVTKINENGITVIIVEHNLRLGLSLAHNVFVLENGKIAFKTKTTDLSQVDYAKKIYLGG